MNSRDQQVLEKIYKHIQSVLDYCKDCKDLAEFQESSMRIEACVFNLMQIGELAKASLRRTLKKKQKQYHGNKYMVCAIGLFTDMPESK